VFVRIAIAADLDGDFATPCGACRQFLSEFNHEIPIVLVKSDQTVKLTSLAQLLPDSFTPKRLSLHFFKN
jgi:cytidine deaminase